MAILITRPDESGRELANMLNKAGIANLLVPFFSIETGRELNELPNKFHQLNAGDYVFCVSRNAVKYADLALRAVGAHWRQDLHYFAVGQGTAEWLSSQGEVAVHYPIKSQNSEGLLELPLMQDLSGKQILVIRGNGGREHFWQQAQQRGAQVSLIESYQRIALQYDHCEQIDLWKRANITQVLATSTEILNALIDFVPEEEQNWLKSCQLITISRRIAELAVAAGWNRNQVVISPKADNSALLTTLLTL